MLALCTLLIDHFSSVDLHKLIHLLHLLTFKSFSLDISFENAAKKMSLGDEDETLSETVVESDEEEDTFDVLTEAIALIESKKLLDGVEWLLADVYEQSSSLISFVSFLVIEKSEVV